MTTDKSSVIAQLNDEHRKLGAYCLTSGCLSLEDKDLVSLIKAVRDYNDFNKNDDPYGERDFGTVFINNEQYFWKIDYYDLSGEDLSPDPSSRALTRRVLTVMQAEEY